MTERRDAPPIIGEMQGVVITHQIQQTFTKFFFGKCSDRSVSNCQKTAGPIKDQNRAEECSLLKVDGRLFCWLEKKTKNRSFFRVY